MVGEGFLLFSDIPANAIMKWTPDGNVSVFRKQIFSGTFPDGVLIGSNGLTLDRQGRVVAAEHGNRRVARYEKSGAVTILADRFEGKRFDLGLYEAGSSRAVRFDRPGISYIFCNIHPEMSAVIITLGTPLYAIANDAGQVSIAGVPYGRYVLHIWSEGMGPENEKPLTREVTVGDGAASLGVIRVPVANGEHMAHKNKYGREYDEPTPDSSIYQQQR